MQDRLTVASGQGGQGAATQEGTPAISPSGQEGLAAKTHDVRQTCIESFVALARHYGLQLTVADLLKDYDIRGACSVRELKKIARKSGFSVRSEYFSWRQLRHLKKELPALAVLKNRNCVILTGVDKNQQVTVVDPLANKLVPLHLGREKFQRSWNGHLVLLKPKFQTRGNGRGSILDRILPWRRG